MQPLTSSNTSRRWFLKLILTLFGAVAGPAFARAQDGTPAMKRRQDRRDDRGDRVQKRDDKFVERRDDPIGVRGPERREDHRDLRTDRKTDRRERVY